MPPAATRGAGRWTDAAWDEYKLAVEIDGAQHTEDPCSAGMTWNGTSTSVLDGYQTLRFPAWLVRKDPGDVAR